MTQNLQQTESTTELKTVLIESAVTLLICDSLYVSLSNIDRHSFTSVQISAMTIIKKLSKMGK